MKITNNICNIITKAAIREAHKNVDSACVFWHYQPIIPQKLLSKKVKDSDK